MEDSTDDEERADGDEECEIVENVVPKRSEHLFENLLGVSLF